MQNERWILPDGIDEVLPEEAAIIERKRRELLDLYAAWGYDFVITPFVEFLDSLLTGTGSDLDLKTFKLTDQLSGRMMGIRADITPQASRIDAHHIGHDTPNRLCYLGTVLHTRSDGFAGSRSPLQIGAELYGHCGVESDIEILRLMMQTLESTGVSDVYLDLGHVGVFKGLARQAGLNSAQEAALFDALQRKATPEIDQLLSTADGRPVEVVFTPHLVPMDRGILTTTYSRPTAGTDEEQVLQALRDFYAEAPFVQAVEHLPATKDTAGTNFVHVTARIVRGRVLTVSSLDNLIKGASGAAVQNFNLMYGYPETTAL